MTVRIRLIHPSKILGKLEPAGKEITAPRVRGLGLVAVGRAELVEDQTGGDRVARDTQSGPAVNAAPRKGKFGQ
ncbi:hypothetical protein KX928_17455 [Roseobacter sp. YSTF-M11]|uniref:Uncharacterized protein n=1 Tax=Roseobacter insulae TaxID=2859783 RepID=A0A9X1JZN4_9RHOB|nr:hypothetical protein [Roseobacter insulae]MBW4709576.1 hypothetical protein [Roseobacter insulae]